MSRPAPLLLALIVLLGFAPLAGLAPVQSARAATPPSALTLLRGQFASLEASLRLRAETASATRTLAGREVAGLAVTGGDPLPPAGLKAEEQQAWVAALGRRDGEAAALAPFFPSRYDEPFAVSGGGATVVFQARDAMPVAAAVDDGKIVYAGAYRDTDSVHAIGKERSEEFLLLRSAAAPTRFAYDILGLEGVTDVTLHERGVRFVGPGGGVQIEAPWLIDATGQRHDTPVRWELEALADGARRLTLVLEPAGLAYPLVIDPTWIIGVGTVQPGNIGIARLEHTATLLSNGQLLVAGGFDNLANATASVEVFDPITGVWRFTGGMSVARKNHTATLLPKGKVLIVGGFNGREGQLAGTEIYDPETGTWAQACPMKERRERHTATLLHTGKVLVVGGQNQNGESVASAEIYDPETACWNTAPSMTYAREKHTATLLPNGKVLVVAGLNGTKALSSELNSTEIYDPSTNRWTSGAILVQARQRHTATLLRDGKVLIVGGCIAFKLEEPPCRLPVSVSEVLAADGLSGTTTDSLARLDSTPECAGGFDHTATLLTDGRVLVVGGRTTFECASNTSVRGRSINSRAIYTPTEPSGSRWNEASLPLPFSPNIGTNARYGHTATMMPNGQVFVTSGYNERGMPSGGNGFAIPSMSYNSSEGSFSPAGVIPPASSEPPCQPQAPPLGPQRADHTATFLPTIQKVLVTGGTSKTGQPLCTAALYDPTGPAGGTWTPIDPMKTARSGHTATLLFSGQVLVAGGLGDAETTSTSEIFDPTAQPGRQWSVAASLTTARYNHTATLLANGQVLVVGGNISALGYTDTAERFDPTVGTQGNWTVTSSIPIPRARHTATLLTDGTVLVVGGFNGPVPGIGAAYRYNPLTAGWSFAGNSSARYWHTATLLPNGRVLVVGGLSEDPAKLPSQLYDPLSGRWDGTKDSNAPRYGHTATLLGSGWVLVAGGYYTFTRADAQLYIPEARQWINVAPPTPFPPDTVMSTGRYAHTATLLPNGKVLIVGGFTAPLRSSPTPAAELYDRGLGFQDPAWRPNVTSLVSGTFTNQLRIGSNIVANGTGFGSVGAPTGGSAGKPEASGGNGAANSATNYPILQLQSLSNEEQRLIPLDQSAGWSATSFASAAIEAFTPGWAFATIIVNGIPSKSFAFEVISPSAGATTWYFAEGYTGSGFDEFLTIQNPNSSAAQVKITYYLGEGGPVEKTFSVPGSSRDTVLVHDTARGVGRGQAVSAKVESTNSVGIIVERPMYFRYNGSTFGDVDGGHNVMGVTATQKTWLFAEGYTGTGFDEYLTIMNPNPDPITVTIDYYLANAPSIQKTIPVKANARYTVAVHDTAEGVGRNQAVSARVTTTHNGGIVVERPMYFRYTLPTKVTVDGGHNVMGAPQPRAAWYFPEGSTSDNALWIDTYLTIMNTNATEALVTLTYFVTSNTPPTTKTVTVPANSRYTVNVHETAEGVGRGKAVASQVTTTNPGGIVVERPMYFRSTTNPARDGGFNVMGAPQPKKAWYFAEGYTGPGFDQLLIMLNPHATNAAVTITYFLDSGPPVVRTLTVPNRGRLLIVVNGTDQVGPGKAVSAKVETTLAGGIIVERPMYFTFNGSMGSVTDAHTVMGYAP